MFFEVSMQKLLSKPTTKSLIHSFLVALDRLDSLALSLLGYIGIIDRFDRFIEVGIDLSSHCL